jgi:hypothetical protein
MSILGDTLPPLKAVGIQCVTKEFARSTSPVTEARLRADMIRAHAELIDTTFIDRNNAGSADEMPASVTFGATVIPSSGSAAVDIPALIAAFEGDLLSAAFVTDPVSAAGIALSRDAGGSPLYPDVGVLGGQLLGLPLIVSRSSPRDSNGGQVVLLDAGAVAFGSEGVRVAVSEQATLAMRDDPDSPAEMVSLFQVDSIAILSEISVNWKVQRPGSVIVASDVNYPVEAAS